MKALQWILSVAVAAMLVHTLFFKFTGHEASIYIFTTIGMEPWGRIGSGVAELIASILLLIPSKRVFGAVLAIGVISGAIFFHLTSLGIEVQGDGGGLFYRALAILFCSVILLVMNRQVLLALINKK